VVDRSTTCKRLCGVCRPSTDYVGAVPKRSFVDRAPRDYITDGEWPDGTVDGPPAALYAQQISIRLAETIGGRSRREVGRLSGVDHTTIASLISGAHWPDLVTIAKCEQGLGVRLWPDLV